VLAIVVKFKELHLLHAGNEVVEACPESEMITIPFVGWISGRIACLQPDTDIQKLLSNGIRISETLFSIFRGFRPLEKIAHSFSRSTFGSIISAFCAMTPRLSMV